MSLTEHQESFALLAASDEFPIYAAMIFIAFLSWMIKRIQDWTQRRKEELRIRRAGGLHETAYQQEEELEDPEFLAREFLESLGVDTPPRRDAVPAPPRVPSPPPLPVVKEVPRKVVRPGGEELTSSEQAVLDRRKKQRHLMRDRRPATAALAAVPASRVRELLQNEQSLRDVIVLAEVLGKPKALSDEPFRY